MKEETERGDTPHGAVVPPQEQSLKQQGWEHREGGDGLHWYVNLRLELQTEKNSSRHIAAAWAVEKQEAFDRENPGFSQPEPAERPRIEFADQDVQTSAPGPES